MSERQLRRRVDLQSRRRAISWAPKPSSSRRRRIKPVAFPSKSLTEKAAVLKRSQSEPVLSCNGVREEGVKGDKEKEEEEEEDLRGVLDRPRTCTDIFDPQEISYFVGRRNNYEIYNKDAKVVVNVTVEGSPGPIRTMVKLGSNVEETIKLVVSKYNEEGRTPRLNTKHAASTFELHHSHFSLQRLSMSDLMGDVGSRTFYLRKSCNNKYSSFGSDDDGSRTTSESIASSIQSEASRSPLIIPRFFDRKLRKFMQKIWQLLGCLPYT